MRKYFLLLVLVVAGRGAVLAQSDPALRYVVPTRTFEEAVADRTEELKNDTGEGGGANAFRRWVEWANNHRSLGGATGDDIFWPMSVEASSFIADPGFYCMSSSPVAPEWKCLGPYTNYYNAKTEYNGRVDFVWGDPADEGHILASGNTGGLWETHDTGHKWRCLTDNALTGWGGGQVPGTVGITYLAVNPMNSDNIYLQIGVPHTAFKSYGYNMGVIYSADAGATWHLDTFYRHELGASPTSGYSSRGMLKYAPGTSTIYAYNGDKVFVKPGTGDGNWTQLWPPYLPINFSFSDMTFSANSAKVVFVGDNHAPGVSKLYIYDTLSGNWTIRDLVLPSGLDTIDNITSLSVSGLDTAFLMLSGHNGSTPFHYLAKTALSSGILTVVNSNVFLGYLKVSPEDQNIMYAAHPILHIYKSTNGGVSFDTLSGKGHDDKRGLTLYKPTPGGTGDILFAATDGGVRMKRAASSGFTSITGDSLCITQFYGLANTEADDGYIEAGAQDNGGYTFNRFRDDRWRKKTLLGGDNYLSKFARKGVKTVYTNMNPPTLEAVTFAGSTEVIAGLNHPTNEMDSCTFCEYNNTQRPFHFDEDNTAYLGFRWVWKKTLAATHWEPAFDMMLPIDSSLDPKVCDIVVADNAGLDTVYIAYRDPGSVDSSSTHQINTKLFLSYDANNPSPPTWNNITDFSKIQYARINDIELAPRNASRLWVAYGDVLWTPSEPISPSAMQNKVGYSPDYGATWYDVSHGLPNFPANKILYLHGSKDILFVATDIGVYRCDFSTFNPSVAYPYGITWQCFNTGMPACQITDMEFNYCANKLRVATFGRGIWETPIKNPWDIVQDGQEITGGGTTHWTEDKYIHGAIKVKTGNTLNIQNCSVHMPRNGAIIVEPGAKLIVNNATLTNNCEGCMWYGIEAKGNPSLPQTAGNQAWIVIQNGSVIENARYAVSNCDYWNDPMGTTGALIQATNSRFINNHNSVTMLDYAPMNYSYFRNCTFLIDYNYRANSAVYPLRNHVHLSGVKNVKFSGCKFINRDWHTTSQGQGVGILSVNSGFSVEPFCADAVYTGGGCGDLRRSYFSGLENGVVVKDVIGGLPTISIDKADFDSVSVGVLVSGYNTVSTTNCSFIVGRGNNLDSTVVGISGCGNIGIALQNVPTFKMENNNFKGKVNPSSISYSSWYNIGVVVAHTDRLQTRRIYRNTFDSLTHGVRAVGNNRGFPEAMSGLQILCNAFSHNGTDIMITPQGPSLLQGIGFEAGHISFPAGNTFTGSTNNIINSCPSVVYYYDSANSATNRPAVVSPNITRWPTFTPNYCPATLPGGGGGAAAMPPSLDETDLATHKAAFFTHKAAFNSLVDTYHGLIDLGEPASELIDDIESSTIPAQLYATLVSASPYLSDDVLLAMIAANKLSYDQTDSILTKNPEVLRHDEVFTTATEFFAGLQANNPLLPDYVSHLTDVANTQRTARSDMESEMAYESSSTDEQANIIMMALNSPYNPNVSVNDTTGAGICTDSNSIYYTLDSNSNYYGMDSVGVWLQNINKPWTVYARMGYYYSKGDYETANNIFTGIIRNNLPAEEKDTYDSYKAIWEVLYGAAPNGRGIYQLTNLEIASLDTFSEPVITHNKGKQILWNLSGAIKNHKEDLHLMSTGVGAGPMLPTPTFPCVMELLSGSKPGSGTDKANGSMPLAQAKGNQPDVKVYPNPSGGTVTFDYNIPQTPNASEGITITVMNVVGEKVMEQQGAGYAGRLLWDPQKLPAGVYIYHAANGKGVVSKGKVVLVR